MGLATNRILRESTASSPRTGLCIALVMAEGQRRKTQLTAKTVLEY